MMGEQQNWANTGSTNAVFPGALFARATLVLPFGEERASLSLLICNLEGKVSTLQSSCFAEEP